MAFVWIFCGAGGIFPSGVFTERARAESWISQHGLTGTLTAYALDEGAYDWAVSTGRFTPTKDKHLSARFIQTFSSAMQEHYHYELGVISGE